MFRLSIPLVFWLFCGFCEVSSNLSPFFVSFVCFVVAMAAIQDELFRHPQALCVVFFDLWGKVVWRNVRVGFFIAWICVIHILCFYPSHPYFVCHIQSLTICIISRLGGFGLFFHFDRLSPTWGNDPNFTSIVSNGCFNHQVVLGSSWRWGTCNSKLGYNLPADTWDV